MKLLYILTIAFSVLAQKIEIGSPAPGTALTIGKTFIVEVDKPVSQGATRSVSVVIGLQRCGTNRCLASDNNAIFGEILYQGDYAPVRDRQLPFKPPYQNFTSQLAASETSQNAIIHVAHLYLNGAGPEVLLERKNVSVTLK